MYWAMSFNSGTLSGNIYLNTLLLGVVEIPAIIVAYFTLNWPPLGRKLTTWRINAHRQPHQLHHHPLHCHWSVLTHTADQ
jgi:hypothetical protein